MKVLSFHKKIIFKEKRKQNPNRWGTAPNA